MFIRPRMGVTRARGPAICVRLVLSEGEVNIFDLAKNAGMSVEQIECFCARNLPLAREMAKNLQSFGEGRFACKGYLFATDKIRRVILDSASR